MKTTYNGKEVKLLNVEGVPTWFEASSGNYVGKATEVKVEYDCKEETAKVARALYLARIKKGYTMDMICALTGIGKPSINGYEKNRITPSIENITRLGLFYGYDFMNIDKALSELEQPE